MTFSGAGKSAGAQRARRDRIALCDVKEPEIWPEPPRIGSLMTGAEMISLSSTIAKRCV